VNPVDIAIACASSGGVKLAFDLSPLGPLGLLPDIADAAMKGSINPVLNSGDWLHDSGDAVELTKQGAEALKKTLPALGPFAKRLGPVGSTISVIQAGRDYWNCAR